MRSIAFRSAHVAALMRALFEIRYYPKALECVQAMRNGSHTIGLFVLFVCCAIMRFVKASEFPILLGRL